MEIYELMPELFSRSEIMILDFNQIPKDSPYYKNIKLFFETCLLDGIDPKLPENRQKFNNEFLEKTGRRYLISRYLEDRIEMLKGSKIAKERRTLHLGIDIFSKDLEDVFAPCDSEIVLASQEEGSHGFGNYVVLKPDPRVCKSYIFLGHLSNDLPKLGRVKAGEKIARLGDFINSENGGWSRHLHVQLFKDFPDINNLIGYTSKENLEQNKINYPNPSILVFN